MTDAIDDKPPREIEFRAWYVRPRPCEQCETVARLKLCDAVCDCCGDAFKMWVCPECQERNE